MYIYTHIHIHIYIYIHTCISDSFFPEGRLRKNGPISIIIRQIVTIIIIIIMIMIIMIIVITIMIMIMISNNNTNDNKSCLCASASRGRGFSILGVLSHRRRANLHTKILDFGGFDSSRVLILRRGILMSIGISPESLSQAILVGIILVGKSGVILDRFEIGV